MILVIISMIAIMIITIKADRWRCWKLPLWWNNCQQEVRGSHFFSQNFKIGGGGWKIYGAGFLNTLRLNIDHSRYIITAAHCTDYQGATITNVNICWFVDYTNSSPMQKFSMWSDKNKDEIRWRLQSVSTTRATGSPTRAVSFSNFKTLIGKHHQVHHLHRHLQAVGFPPRGLSTTPTMATTTMTLQFLRSLVTPTLWSNMPPRHP